MSAKTVIATKARLVTYVVLLFGTALASVGNFDRHALQTLQLNNVPFGAYALPTNVFNSSENSANLLRTQYPGMGSISMQTNSNSGVNYHGLQASLNRRFSNGMTMNC